MIEPIDNPERTAIEDKPEVRESVDTEERLTLEKSSGSSDVAISPRTGKPKRKYTKRDSSGKPTSAGDVPKRTPEQVKADKAMLATALAGAFQGLGVILGPHWPLQTKEQPDTLAEPMDQAAMLAEVWDPVLERYGASDLDKFRDALMWISASAVTIALVKPRIEVTVSEGHGLVGWIKRKLAARRVKRP